MSARTPAEIGARVRAIRRHRAMSVDVAAGLAGISRSYLMMLERGDRHFNRRGLVENVAAALGCSPADLTGQPYDPVDKPSAEAIATIPQVELALHDATLDDVPDLPARPIWDLVADARLANEYRDAARYDLAGRGLGQLLTELQVTAVTTNGGTRQAALAALVEACMVAHDVAGTFGHAALAVQAAERGQDAAQRLGDPAVIGFADWHWALALVRVGARRRAGTGFTRVINALVNVDPTTVTAAREAYGFAQLGSALIAARSGRADTAHEHLEEASRIASHTGDLNSLLMHFGPTNVAVWRLAIGVELQEAGKAYERATTANIDTALLGSADRISALHFDLARALAQEGGPRDIDAIRHLDIADQTSPQRMRHDPIAREVVRELDIRARKKLWMLDSLRHRFGLAPTH